MKTIKFLGLLLITLLLLGNLTSCAKKNEYGMPIKIDSTTIIYKTSDNVILRFKNEDVFGGAKIISNKYSTTKGYGTLEFDSEVTAIEEKAFYNCKTLISIVLPSSIFSIGNYAFCSCHELTNFAIPNSVTSIGNDAFDDCKRLTSVTIPKSVTNIGDKAFNSCSGLESIIVESGNTVYDSRNNCNAIIKTSTNTLIQGCKNTTIPNSITSIGNWAFSSCLLTNVSIPNSVTSIEKDAFNSCLLTSVIVPNSVTSIGDRVFNSCLCLTSITIPNSVTSIGEDAFDWCVCLTEIYCNATPPPTAYSSTFDDILTTATLYVPVGAKNAYANAVGWRDFSNIIEKDF